jgi:hypothetical protein
MSTGKDTTQRRNLMNTMHEMLLPELVEMKNTDRLHKAEMGHWLQEATKVDRPARSFRIEAKLHLPRLRRRSTAGTM